MDANIANVIIALIGAVIPAAVTVCSNSKQNKTHAEDKKALNKMIKENAEESSRNDMKQSIQVLILSDKVAWRYGELPTHYNEIHSEYDYYHDQLKGNGVVTRMVQDYDKWHNQVQEEAHLGAYSDKGLSGRKTKKK